MGGGTAVRGGERAVCQPRVDSFASLVSEAAARTLAADGIGVLVTCFKSKEHDCWLIVKGELSFPGHSVTVTLCLI